MVSGINTWTFAFPTYIDDLPQITNNNSKIVIFRDDTSIIVTNTNHIDFKNDSTVINYIK
jgi:hypothetical protein